MALRKAASLIAHQPTEAASVLAEILAKFPNNVRAAAYLADIEKRAQLALNKVVLQRLHELAANGRVAEIIALTKNLPAAAFGSADLHLILGQALSAAGRHSDAAAHLNAATQLQPASLVCWIAAGNAAFLSGDFPLAERYFKGANKLAPSNDDVLNNLGMTLAAQRRFDAAEETFAAAAAINPKNHKIPYNRANALRDAGRLHDAISFYREALSLKPDYASAGNNLGTVLHQLGRDTEAEAAYMQAIGFQPEFAQAHRNLSAVHKYSPNDPALRVLERSMIKRLSERDRMYMSFARSKAHEDNAEYHQAFELLVEANAIRKKLLGYDIATDQLLFNTLHKLFAQPLSPLNTAHAVPRPVFVLGMMRSGTTLVEQIIASHSDVHGAGELETLGQLCLPIMERFYSTQQRPSTDDLSALRKSYLNEISSLSDGNSTVVTDKMPVNFRWIGFILSAFPEAKIIHMKREPVATCWSIFKHYFSSDGNGYAFDLKDVATYWHLYSALMAHWHKLFPDQILDVQYEALTEAPEEWSRRIIDFTGLAWQDACLNFHLNDRAIRTASASQVKRQIYKGSSEAWRKFETNLAPLISALQVK